MGDYCISLKGLFLGENQVNYQIDKLFFAEYGYTEFNNVNLKVDILVIKKSNLFEATLSATGNVNVNCDLSLNAFDLPMNTCMDLIIKFGASYNELDFNLITIPHNEHIFDFSQYIYEMIILAIPLRKVHPKIENNSLESEVVNKLRKLDTKNNITNSNPQWDALKSLIA